MPPAVLYPHYDHDAVEESFASWQAQMRLRREHGPLFFYDDDETTLSALEDVDAEYILVITDPLLVPPPHFGDELQKALTASKAFAAVPMTNETGNDKQRGTVQPYMTLRELEEGSRSLRGETAANEVTRWERGNPGAFLVRTADARALKQPLLSVIDGRDVVVARNLFVHRWSSMRGQVRQDLLDRIGADAKSVLEFGCGEGQLGAALKSRQKCRVVGVELDPAAAAVARRRIDDVYCGDVREIVSLIHEQFDWIVGGDIVEHLDEPWSFLSELRRISKPGGRLLLSLPNIANASIINDLLHGRFDYVYMGLTCVGHVRFFTRRSIEDMFAIAGWPAVDITPQAVITTAPAEELMKKLEAAGIEFSREDLVNPGYYVVAQNR